MKKILSILSIFLLLNSISFAGTPVDFIYINGSNNNSPKMYSWFIKGINKFHPYLKTQIEKDKYTYEHFLNNGEYVIEEKPSNYFWGYKSQEDLMFMREKANSLRSISPFIAFCVRNTIADIMHDAIWVQKSHNMIPIIQELDTQIKADVKQGKKVVLLGYSAGTFITMEYLFNKAPYIDIKEWFSDKNLDKDLTTMIEKNPRKDTCLMAFVGSNLTNASPLGQVMTNPNKKEFKQAYLNIDSYTDKYCVPEGSVLGVINYASPIPLFYSDMTDKRTDGVKFYKLLYKYLIEHKFFFLTVNWADDPLGFPNGANRTNDELKKLIDMDFDSELGFFYDYSKRESLRTFAGAHTSYWNSKKRFAKAIVKGYTEGRMYQYDEDTVNKRNNKKSKK